MSKLLVEFEKRSLESHFVDEMIDNHLRLLLNKLTVSSLESKLAWLEKRYSAKEIIEEADRARKVIVEFNKRHAPGEVKKRK